MLGIIPRFNITSNIFCCQGHSSIFIFKIKVDVSVQIGGHHGFKSFNIKMMIFIRIKDGYVMTTYIIVSNFTGKENSS
jgi:hypothetical protein